MLSRERIDALVVEVAKRYYGPNASATCWDLSKYGLPARFRTCYVSPKHDHNSILFYVPDYALESEEAFVEFHETQAAIWNTQGNETQYCNDEH